MVEGRYADGLAPEIEKVKAELGATATCDEDVLSYIAFPEVAKAFFKDREAGFPKKEAPKAAPKAEAAKAAPAVGSSFNFVVNVNGNQYAVAGVVGDAAAPAAAPAPAPAAPAAAPAPAAPAAAPAAGETAVKSPMPGNVFKVECKVGQSVNAGDVLVVLEAMKMEIEVAAPCAGTVKAVAANVGATVTTDDLLVTLG